MNIIDSKNNISISYPDLLKNNIRKLVTEDDGLNYTLRELIIKVLSQNFQQDNFKEFVSIFIMLHSSEFKIKDFNENVTKIFKPNSPLEISIKLIAQLGEKNLDLPLFEILSEKNPHTSLEKPLLQSISLYQGLYKSISVIHKNTVKLMKETLAQFNHLIPILDNNPETRPLIDALSHAKTLFENLDTNIAIINSVLNSTLVSTSDSTVINDFNYLKAKNIYKICCTSIKNISKKTESETKIFFEKTRKISKNFPQTMDTSLVDVCDQFLNIISEKQKSLLEQYHQHTGTKSDAKINQDYTDVLFKNEFLAEEKRYQASLIKHKFNLETPKLIEQIEEPIKKTPSLNLPLPEIELSFQDQLWVHSREIHEFSSKIKKTLFNAKMHSKEIQDHLTFASLNFQLFCQAIEKHDFYALAAIIPFFCMDVHLVNEQLLKAQLALKGNPWIKSHNLSHLRSFQEEDLELEAFLIDFSDALLQSRYPIEKSASFEKNSLPGPLKWILYSHQPNKSNKKDLTALCDFVLNSYENTLKHVCNAIDGNISCNFAKPFLEKALTRSLKKSSKPSLNLQNKLLKAHSKTDQMEAKQALEEISHYFIQIEAVHYLQEHYPDIRFSALHHRNCMMFQWPLEKLYALKAIREGMGDLRYLSEDHSSANHDLTVFHAVTLHTQEIPPSLKEFNFGRKLHYHREKNSPLLENLTFARKNLKKVKVSDKLPQILKKNREEVLKKGLELLEKTIISTQAT